MPLTKITQKLGAIEVVSPNIFHLGATAEQELLSPDIAATHGKGAALYDLSGIKSFDYSGLCALADLHYGPHQIGFFGADQTLGETLNDSGLNNFLNIAPNLQNVLQQSWLRPYLLADKKAVILSAGKGTRCAPMTRDYPKPLLPVLGRPIMYHIMQYLRGFNIQEVLLNPSYLGPQIHDYFQDGQQLDLSITYADEGKTTNGEWVETPLGSASTLGRMQKEMQAFDDDFVVLCGDGLCECDLVEMMDRHKETGAALTIATYKIPKEDSTKYGLVDFDQTNKIRGFQEKPAVADAVSPYASIGLYIINPRALNYITDEPGQDIANHLLPRLMEAGETLANYTVSQPWTDIGCGRDFFRANVDFLSRAKANPEAFGLEWKKDVALAPGGQMMNGVSTAGPIYIGEGAIVHSGAQLIGPCFIGAGAVVEKGSYLERSYVMPDTHIMNGAYAVDMVISGDWAFSHPFATGGAENSAPLEYTKTGTWN